MTKRKSKGFLSLLLAFAMVFTTCIFAGLPIATKAVVAENTLRVDENGDFTILQVADMQGCYPLPDQWINALRLSIAASEPDLIVLTGDNVVNNDYSEGVWHTLDQIIREFVDKSGNPIPFAITTGNHDYDSNGHDWIPGDYYNFCKNGTYANGAKNRTVANGYKGFYNDNENFNGYSNFVDYDKGVGYEKGTGYIDIYSNDGTTVVERVIMINSGSYDDNGGYGKPGYSVGYNTNYNKDSKYTEVVNAVNTWTSDSSIKCIAFQHIPLREFYKGDSASTSILTRATSQVNSSYLKAYGAIGDSNITSGWYAPNTSNSSVSGIYTETCCCSYGDTSDLYNALAKNNVAGIFYGHDHGNTLTGVSTVGGKSLRQGYGGGLNTEWNGAVVSLFSYYTLNSSYSGVNDSRNFKKVSSDYSAYLSKIGASYGTKTYTPSGVNYISTLGLEYAPHSIFQQRTFERAVKNLGSSYTPLLKMYNDPSANADLNRSTGSDTDDVCIGYKTSTNPTDAITGIIGYRTGSDSHPKTISVDLQNGHKVTYYLDDNNVDCSGGISKYYTLVYYTRDPMAGPPITNLYMTYDDHAGSWSQYNMKTGETIGDYKVCSWLSDDLTHLQEWRAFDFNTGCGAGTCYLYLEYASHGTEDVTREYYDLLTAYDKYGKVDDPTYQIYTKESYDAYANYRNQVETFIDDLNAPYSPKSGEEITHMVEVMENAYDSLTLQPTENGKQVTVDDVNYTDYKIAVPETVYLTPDASVSPRRGQYYLNNKIDANGNLVADGTYAKAKTQDNPSETGGIFEIQCKDAERITVEGVLMKPQGSGQRFRFQPETSSSYDDCYYDDENDIKFELWASDISGTLNQELGSGKKYDGTSFDEYRISSGGIKYIPTHENGTDLIRGKISDLKVYNYIEPGQTGMIEWRFTITRANTTVETVYAYTTVYSPLAGTSSTLATQTFQMRGLNITADKNRVYLNWAMWMTGVNTIEAYSGSRSGGEYSTSNGDGMVTTNASYKLSPLTFTGTMPTTNQHSYNASYTSCLSNGNIYETGTGYKGYSGLRWHADGSKSGTKATFTAYWKAVLYADSSRYTSTNQIPNFQTGVDVFQTDDGNGSYSNGSISFGLGWYQSGGTANETNLVATDSSRTLGRRYSNVVPNISITANSNTTNTYILQSYGTARNNGSEVDTTMKSYFDVVAVNKSSLRTKIGTYESLSPQSNWMQAGQESKFTDYMNELIAASYNLGNPASTNVDEGSLNIAFNALSANQKRSDTINGVNMKFFTLETNYALKGVLNGYGQRTGYSVDSELFGPFKYEGRDITGDGIPDGIGSMETILVQPYTFGGYSYVNWMDGTGFDENYVDYPELLQASDYGFSPQLGDVMSNAMFSNLYDDFNTSSKTNYGHITKNLIETKGNEFYFYYKKADHTLTFNLDGGNFTYDDTNYTGTQYVVTAAEGDSFAIAIIPARTGYTFDGWQLVTSNGTYNNITREYTFGAGNDTIKAKWIKQATLNIDSNEGHSANNLIYLPEGRSTYSGGNADMDYTLSYEADSDITITGERYNSAAGEKTASPIAYVYLEYGKQYTFSFDSNNDKSDFYVFAPNGKHCNFVTNATVTNSDGIYHYTKTVTVGTNNGDSSWGNAGVDTSTLTGVYYMRFDQDAYTGKKFEITNLRITEVTESAGVDNKIIQLENSSRVIQNPPKRSDGYVFDGWTLTGGGSVEENAFGCYTYTYSDTDGTLTAKWVKPIGVAMDNMFNFYEWRYNDNSNKLSGNKTSGDTISFNNNEQSFTIKDDGTGNADVYTAYGQNNTYYNIALPKYQDNGVTKTYTSYQLTMDVDVINGSGQYFVFGYDSAFSATNTVCYERPISASKHVENVFTVGSNISTLQIRFGFYTSGSQIKFSNIRLVPLNAATVDDDTLGYAEAITPETLTVNTCEGKTIGSELYRPTREGYAFVGWNGNLDGTGAEFKSSTVVEGNTVIWSNWSADEYILQYNENTTDTITGMPKNNATGAPSQTSWTLIYDKATRAATDGIISNAIPKNGTNVNKLFIGWNTMPDGSGTAFYPNGDVARTTINLWYNDAQQSTNSDGKIDRTKTLYAQWYDVSDAVTDVNKQNSDYKQLTSEVVRGVNVDANGKYTSTLKDITVTKFDAAKYKDYTDAVTAFSTAKTNIATSVTAANVEALKTGNTNVVVATEALKNAVNQSNVVANYYADKFVVKQNGVEKLYSLADMNLNHYATDTLTGASNAKTNGKTYAYSSGTTLRKAFDAVSGSTAQAKLNEAVETMAKAFVDEKDIGVKPMYQVYETPAAVANALNSSDDIDAVNYVYSGLGGYTYYCYTNKPNPQVVIDIDEISANNRVCYPTTAVKAEDSSNTAKITTKTVTNTTYDSLLQNGLGTKMTESNANYYKQKQAITLNPSFNADSIRSTVTYKFKAYDDSYSADHNYATKSALSGDVFNNNRTTDIEQTAVTGANEISIIINYKPANGFDVTGSQWDNGTNYDQYLNQYHLWRTSGGANNWEIHGKNDAAAQVYAVYDENYQQINYCSFFYVFNVGSSNDNSKCQIKSSNLDDVHNFIKDNFKNLLPYTSLKSAAAEGTVPGLGYKSWSGADGWAPNLYPQSNSYVYVHVLDRWGNVVDKVFQVHLMDPNEIKTSSTSAGNVLLEESGGSGIDTASINASSFTILTDEHSTLVDNVYRTSGNTVLLNTGVPNKSYTITLTDHATNKTTSTVKTDAEGNLLITVEDEEYKGGIYTFSLDGYEINLYDASAEPAKGKVVDVQYEAAVGTTNTYNVKVEDRANMLQFIELDKGNGTGTRSYDRYDERVTIVSYDAQGNVVSSTSKDLAYEIWTVETPLADGNIGVRVKESGSKVWEDKELAYNFTNEYANADSGLVSAELAKTEGAKGAVGFTVVTGSDVKSVQLKNEEGETTTVKAANATVNADGTLTFTGKIWFHSTGTRIATVRILDAYGWHDAGTLEYVINK